MDSPVPDRGESPDLDLGFFRLIEFRRAENSWLGEIADQLESDPQECWQAARVWRRSSPS